MNIAEVNYKIKCDMPNCKDFAHVKIEKTGFLKSAGFYLCKSCMNEMYNQLGGYIVPKSPNNMLNKKIKGVTNVEKK